MHFSRMPVYGSVPPRKSDTRAACMENIWYVEKKNVANLLRSSVYSSASRTPRDLRRAVTPSEFTEPRLARLSSNKYYYRLSSAGRSFDRFLDDPCHVHGAKAVNRRFLCTGTFNFDPGRTARTNGPSDYLRDNRVPVHFARVSDQILRVARSRLASERTGVRRTCGLLRIRIFLRREHGETNKNFSIKFHPTRAILPERLVEGDLFFSGRIAIITHNTCNAIVKTALCSDHFYIE